MRKQRLRDVNCWSGRALFESRSVWVCVKSLYPNSYCLLLKHFYRITEENSITLDKEMINRNYHNWIHITDSIRLPDRPMHCLGPWRLGRMESQLPLGSFWIPIVVYCSEGVGKKGKFALLWDHQRHSCFLAGYYYPSNHIIKMYTPHPDKGTRIVRQFWQLHQQ